MRKTSIKVVPVTAEIDGQRVVVGEASLAVTGEEVVATVQLDLSTPEGLNMASMFDRGLTNAISVSSDRADLINKVAERNKQFKEENPDDGTVGRE